MMYITLRLKTLNKSGIRQLDNIRQSGKRFVLSLHYNGSNSFIFANATKIYKFRAKDSEIKDYALYLDLDL